MLHSNSLVRCICSAAPHYPQLLSFGLPRIILETVPRIPRALLMRTPRGRKEIPLMPPTLTNRKICYIEIPAVDIQRSAGRRRRSRASSSTSWSTASQGPSTP